jgi:hypothetical protein
MDLALMVIEFLPETKMERTGLAATIASRLPGSSHGWDEAKSS